VPCLVSITTEFVVPSGAGTPDPVPSGAGTPGCQPGRSQNIGGI